MESSVISSCLSGHGAGDDDTTMGSNTVPQQEQIVTSELNLFYLCFSVIGPSMKDMHTISTIVEAAIDTLLEKFKEDNTSSMCTVILHLSNFPQIQERMFYKFSTSLKQVLEQGSTSSGAVASASKNEVLVKEFAVEVLRNLSRSPSNKSPIYQQLLETLLDCLTIGQSLRIKRYALGTLNNLATLDENAIALLRKPMFLETVLGFAQNGGTSTIKERAIWTLQSLACADENEVPMFEMPSLIQTLVDCVDHGDTNEIKSYAIETLRNLSNRNQARMFRDRKLVNALTDTVVSGETLMLKNLALSCFQRMGYSRLQVYSFILLEALCSARDCPRLVAKGNCPLQSLPNELIRKVGEALYGR
jgi:hypothetical protein